MGPIETPFPRKLHAFLPTHSLSVPPGLETLVMASVLMT